MNTREVRQNEGHVALLPHQSALVDTFFNPATKRILQLRGEAGLGKSTTLLTIANRLLREQPTCRVLFLVPAPLGPMYVEMLRGTGTPALHVDRYVFRELLDSESAGEIWPDGSVFVLSRNFAKQPDILDTLLKARWTLLVIDEADGFKGAQARNALARIISSADRTIIASMGEHDMAKLFPTLGTEILVWSREQILNKNSVGLEAVPAPNLHEISFSLSQPEIALNKLVISLCHAIPTDNKAEQFVASILIRCLQSSPSALEHKLAQMAARSFVPEDLKDKGAIQEEEPEGDSISESVHQELTGDTAAIARQALNELETIESDSKLKAFAGLVSRLNESQTPVRVCVLTEYIATLYYLAAEIESLGLPCVLLHSGITTADRQEILSASLEAENVLIATYVVAEGFSLGHVTDLVLYDVANGERSLRQALGRFDRIGRQCQLNVHVLLPSGITDGHITRPIEALREIFAERANLEGNL